MVSSNKDKSIFKDLNFWIYSWMSSASQNSFSHGGCLIRFKNYDENTEALERLRTHQPLQRLRA